MSFPEREPVVQKQAEEIKLPQHLENEGIKSVETAFKANVQDAGRSIITTPETQRIELKIPNSSGNFETWSKGSIDDGTSWFAIYWLRQIKRAMHFGWQIVWGTNAS